MQITEKILWRGKEVEILRPGLYVDTIDLVCKQSWLARHESNDCVVRSFMIALDLSYEQSHIWVKTKLNRVNRRGTLLYFYCKNIINTIENGYKINYLGYHPSKEHFSVKIGLNKTLINKKYKNPTGYTLKSFMENNPIGRFVLLLQGHAVAVINGKLYGDTYENIHGLYRSVWMGFEINKI